MAEGSDTAGPPAGGSAEVQPGADWPDDPVEVMARVFALRQVADLGGFPHLPEWDRMEAWARNRLSPSHAVPGATTAPHVSHPRDPHVSADPFLAFAEVSAARLVADEQGMQHAAAWDETEREVREELHRSRIVRREDR